LKCPKSKHQLKNEEIAGEIRKIHDEHPDMGYRRIRDELAVNHDMKVNDKRVLNLNRKLQIHSCIKYRPKSCTRNSDNPYHIAKNYLHREFHAEAPNQKWLTDVSEFKYYTGIEVHKVYLSAILDLYDRRIVAFKISDHNDNPLVMNTFDETIKLEPDAHPLFHSDRGFQYTSREFYTRLQKFHMKQSMSRVAHCIDNGPMEGFWGMLKREMYYGHRFTDHDVLIKAISDYIDYYNNRRLQRRLKIMTPMEFHNNYQQAA
jgi:transposase InsO family protein